MSIRNWLLCVLLAFLACSACVEVPDTPGTEPEEPEQNEPETPGDKPGEEVGFDGLVKKIQEATAGKGLDIVLMGDGFTQADFESGRYDTVMETAMGHLFSIEPASSLRKYFNVYTVGVVSEDSSLSGKSGLKCEGTMPGKTSEKLVDEYGRKVPGLAVDSTVFCIILNTNRNGGWTTHHSYKTQKAYAFCPMIQSTPANQYYKLMLVHETIGHAFAKLADEYTMSGYENKSPGTVDKMDLKGNHKCYYDLNVTYSKDVESCPWKDFLGDERYASEKIGFYEGTGYFGRNSWRPTDVNLMNRTSGKSMDFSAPQRKIIYDRVHRRAEGRIPTYEEFVSFDKKKQ